MRLIIESDPGPLPAARRVEVVERKGVGHPDTLCDGVAEAVSRALGRAYLEAFDTLLHHNVDKVLLVGGRARPAFGGGEVLEPMELVVAGRATYEARGRAVPVEELAVEATRAYLRTRLHALDVDRHVRVSVRLRPGSRDLVDLFLRSGQSGRFLANDTSLGVGFAPLSPLERAVVHLEGAVRGAGGAHPEVGEDVKVMAVREGDAVEATVAAALVGRHLPDLGAYRDAKEAAAARAAAALSEALPGEHALEVNAADAPDTGVVYLTVTGTSAESGDDGEAGRGNRAVGFVSPGRPTTLESVAGKNPASHVGKLYNVAAQRIARAVFDEVPGALGCACLLVSRIGRPVDEPVLAQLRVHAPEADPAHVHRAAEALAHEGLASVGALWRDLLGGPFPSVDAVGP